MCSGGRSFRSLWSFDSWPSLPSCCSESISHWALSPCTMALSPPRPRYSCSLAAIALWISSPPFPHSSTPSRSHLVEHIFNISLTPQLELVSVLNGTNSDIIRTIYSDLFFLCLLCPNDGFCYDYLHSLVRDVWSLWFYILEWVETWKMALANLTPSFLAHGRRPYPIRLSLAT